MFEREIRDLAFVPRWGIVRTNRQQYVAEHSFFVAIYADQIAELISWKGPRDVLMRAAMMHDFDEIISGDINSPTKRVIKKAAQIGQANIDKWLWQMSIRRMPDYTRWTDIDPDAWYADDIESIVHVADILEAVLYLADETFAGNNNVWPQFNYLCDAMFDKVESHPLFVGHEALITALKCAVHSAQCSPSELVRGDEELG